MTGTTLLRTGAAAALVALAALGFAAGACGSTDVTTSGSPAPLPPGPIRIGAIFSLTGNQTATDGPALDGARLAVDRINAGGGLLGRRVELLERDGVSHPAYVRTAARGLANADVSAMIGLSDSDLVLAAAPLAAAAGIPFVTSGATSAKLPGEVPRWLFLASYGDNAQAAAGAEYAYDRLGARRAAVLYDTDRPASRRLASYFVTSFRYLGGAVPTRTHTHSGERDVTKFVEAWPDRPVTGDDEGEDGALERIDPDVVYLAARAADAAPLVRKLRAAGFHGAIIGGDTFDTDVLRKVAAKVPGSVYYTTHSSLGLWHSTTAVRQFAGWFTSAFGRAPENSSACLGYDAVQLVAAAVTAAESADPEMVRDALLAIRGFHGVTGMLSYGTGRAPRKEITVVRVGSHAELVAQLKPRYVPKP